jgi:hypothetical protein
LKPFLETVSAAVVAVLLTTTGVNAEYWPPEDPNQKYRLVINHLRQILVVRATTPIALSWKKFGTECTLTECMIMLCENAESALYPNKPNSPERKASCQAQMAGAHSARN